MSDFAYIVSKILWFPARPGHFALLVGATGLAMIWRGRRFGRWLVLACLAFFFALIATPISQFILLPLEDRFPRPAEAPQRVDGIVVLGGAVDQNITDERGNPAINCAAERITEAVALARRFTEARIVYTSVQGSQPISPTMVVQGRRAVSESVVAYCMNIAWMVDSTASPVCVLAAVAFFHDLFTGGFSSIPDRKSVV
jgi:uncharacterized SAM-binding protein YcdF (DUF218 family)